MSDSGGAILFVGFMGLLIFAPGDEQRTADALSRCVQINSEVTRDKYAAVIDCMKFQNFRIAADKSAFVPATQVDAYIPIRPYEVWWKWFVRAVSALKPDENRV